MKQLTIKQTHHDSLFFASAKINEKKNFYLRFEEFKLLLKLIHYESDKQPIITWQSVQIAKHLITTVCAVDKNIQRLKQKGYIYVTTKQMSGKAKTRSIRINWNMIESIDLLYKEWILSLENASEQASMQEISQPIQEEIIQPEPIKEVFRRNLDLHKWVDDNIGNGFVNESIHSKIEKSLYNTLQEITDEFKELPTNDLHKSKIISSFAK